MDDQFYAVTFYMGGSWVYDALHDISDEQKKHLIMGFIDQCGKQALNDLILHQADPDNVPIPACLHWLPK